MPDSQKNNDSSTDGTDAEIVEAEIVPANDDRVAHSAEVSTIVASDALLHGEWLLDTSVSHLSAKGGAVGGVLLAVLGLVGMMFSLYSIFNILLAIIFSVWGLKSPLRKTAITALLIALAGLVLYFIKLDS